VLVAVVAGGVAAVACLLLGAGAVLMAGRAGLVLLPIGVAHLVVAGTCLWGGVLARRGRGSLLLQAGGGSLAFVAAAAIALSAAGGLGVDRLSVLLLLLGLGIVVLLRQTAVRSWFAAHGTR
jgi:hypothetical protein